LKALLKAEMTMRKTASERAATLARELTTLRASNAQQQSQWFAGTAALRQSISLIAGAAPKKSRFGRGKKKDVTNQGGDGGLQAGMDGAMQNAQQQAEMLKTVVGPMEHELTVLRKRLVLEARRTATAEAAAAAATAANTDEADEKDAAKKAAMKEFQAAEAIALAASRRRAAAAAGSSTGRDAAGPSSTAPSPGGGDGGSGAAAAAAAAAPPPAAPVPDRIRIAQLEHQLVLEQSARADLAIQSQVQVTQRGVLLGELESCRLELGRERSAHADLKYTWHGARFLTEIYTRGCHWIPRMFA
jgi:hypothetical protein